MAWSGDKIGAAQEGKQEVEVPAFGDFKVASVDSHPEENRVDIYFSDPLEEDQDFNGLVTISNTDNAFRFAAEGQVLRVYLPTLCRGSKR
ncbi:MAG: hypothetical protein R2795_07695 [Saprospiraceae bacterium]